MTSYELISTLVSVIAAVISVVSLVRTRNIAEEQLKLERVTAQLSSMQMSQIKNENIEKQKPKINIAITKIGNSSHFIIANIGQGSAYDLSIELIDCPENPLAYDFQEKIPCPELKANSRIKLHASFHMQSPLTYQVKAKWRDISGEETIEKF